MPPGAPIVFEKIGIVGLGLIGGSIALASRQIWPTSLVIGVDNKDVLETAMRLHAIDVAADDIPPTSHSVPLTNVYRDDVVQPSLTQEEALSGAPDSAEGRFRVPRILDEE